MLRAGLTNASSPADTLGKIAVALLLHALQKVFHILKLICRSAPYPGLSGHGRTPVSKILVVRLVRVQSTLYPAVFLLVYVFLFFSGRFGFGGLFIFVFLLLECQFLPFKVRRAAAREEQQ